MSARDAAGLCLRTCMHAFGPVQLRGPAQSLVYAEAPGFPAPAGQTFIDPVRCLRLGTYGLAVDGPFGHLWYKILDRTVEPENPQVRGAASSLLLPFLKAIHCCFFRSQSPSMLLLLLQPFHTVASMPRP